MEYDINFQILNYDLFYKVLENICENKDNKFNVITCNPIGYSPCGFPIHHFSIGTGPYEVVYMAGTHGNEIIGVDFVLQLMKNLALGKGKFAFFRPELFTVHFIPLQNPEGFFTTTYAIHNVIKDNDRKKICKDYYLNYRKANNAIHVINDILLHFFKQENLSNNFEMLKRHFWKKFYGRTIILEHLKQFFSEIPIKYDECQLEKFWNSKLQAQMLTFPFDYQKPFINLDCNCIPEITSKHQMLKRNIEKMFHNYPYPNYMLENFCANSLGINLNENNEYYFNELKRLVQEEGNIPVAPIYGNFPKNILGPFSAPSFSKDNFFYTTENIAILNFLKNCQETLYAFINCHSTGGQLYFYPYDNSINYKESDFTFYINNRIATDYLKTIQLSYQESGSFETYEGMGYPSKISGFGDILRVKYPASFLLELSRAGGNPLGPYIFPNYYLTMKVNMDACMSLLNTILKVQHLYNKTYEINYDRFGRIKYNEKVRTFKL